MYIIVFIERCIINLQYIIFIYPRSEGARGSAAEGNMARGLRGLRGEEERLRAHEPRSGGSRDDGGGQSGPRRRGDLSRPDPPTEIFQTRSAP